MENEVTFYRFYSEVRSFLAKLLDSPIDANVSQFMRDNGVTKRKLIEKLIKKGVLERHEKIMDRTNDETVEKPQYIVKYKVKRKNFERNIHRLYSQMFEKNVPERKMVNEDGEGGGEGCPGGATGCFASSGSYETKLNRPIKKVFMNERQLRHIQEIINTPNAGDDILSEKKKRKKTVKNSDGETVPEFCDKCGSKVGLYIQGEPVYLCSNKKCGKYFGVARFPNHIKESLDGYTAYNVVSELIKKGYLVHGTNSDFEKFDKKYIKGGCRGREGYGFYFSDTAYKPCEYGNSFYYIKKDDFNFLELTSDVTRGSEIYDKIIGREEWLDAQKYILSKKLENANNWREFEKLESEIDKLNDERNNFKSKFGDAISIIRGTIYKDNVSNVGQLEYNIPKNYIPKMAELFAYFGYDGYHYDNVYTVFNFDKLNRLVKKYDVDKALNESCGKQYKGKENILGYDIVIEYRKGDVRKGTDKDGNKWERVMHNDYGYFSHTIGKDGEGVDVYLGDNFNSNSIFAIDQRLDGKFDETKFMLGFKDEEAARKAYLSNYEKGWQGLWKITEVPHDVFRKWLYDGYRQRKPFFEYVDIERKRLNENIVEDIYEEGGYDAMYVLNDFVQSGGMYGRTVKQSWAPLINPAMYQKALQEFTQYGKLMNFPSKYIYQWLGIIVRNTLILAANTELAGHDTYFPTDDIADSLLPDEICEKYGFDSIEINDTCTIHCGVKYIIDKIMEKEMYLSKEEKEFISGIDVLNEYAVHQTGKYKGQTHMFATQDELDRDDIEIAAADERKSKRQVSERLVEIYNSLYEGQENRVNYSQTDNIAEVAEDGGIIMYMDLFKLLDEVGLYDWMQMPDGSDAWSDYGLSPLYKVIDEYTDDSTPEQTLVIVNKALDVYHQRGDMASIFIEGGSKTLSQITYGSAVNESKGDKNMAKKRVIMTERQIDYIKKHMVDEAADCAGVGGENGMDYAASAIDFKTSDGKKDPTLTRKKVNSV